MYVVILIYGLVLNICAVCTLCTFSYFMVTSGT